MLSTWLILFFVHLLGLSLGIGAATVKLTLLLKCNSDQKFVPTFIAASKPITKIIILGLILLTLSGIGWIILGTSFTILFIVKLTLVVTLWVLGPIIDNSIEPKYLRLVPISGQPATTEFIKIQRNYVFMETIATGLFYAIMVIGVLL